MLGQLLKKSPARSFTSLLAALICWLAGLGAHLAAAAAPGPAPAPAAAPGGLAAPVGTAVGVAAAEIMYDFRSDRPGHIAIAPWATARYTLENPTDRVQQVPLAMLYQQGLSSPYLENEFFITWQGQETLWPANPARVFQIAVPRNDLSPPRLRYLNPTTGERAGEYETDGTPLAYELTQITLAPHDRQDLTIRYRHSYTTCQSCGSREPHWYWTVPLTALRGWAYFRNVKLVALTPPDVSLSTDPPLQGAPGPGPGEQTFTGQYDTLPPADLHMAAVLHRPLLDLEQWPWYLVALVIGGGALWWQYRSSARAQQSGSQARPRTGRATG